MNVLKKNTNTKDYYGKQQKMYQTKKNNSHNLLDLINLTISDKDKLIYMVRIY